MAFNNINHHLKECFTRGAKNSTTKNSKLSYVQGWVLLLTIVLDFYKISVG